MVRQLSRTFQLQAILCQLQITPGTWINKLLSMKRPPLRDLLCKTSFNLCSACGGAASLLGSGRVTSGIRSWNVFGMCQEVKSNQCEKNTTGSFLIWSQAAFFTSRRDTPMCPALLLCSFFFSMKNLLKPSGLIKRENQLSIAPEGEISTSSSFLCPLLSLLQGNKGKTGVIIAAYMHYSKISAGWVCVC